jgi:hypothetical protein
MPANCVSQSTRNALRLRHANESIDRREAGATHMVLRIQKNGKTPPLDDRGVTRFTEANAIAFRDRYLKMNPHLTLEVVAI